MRRDARHIRRWQAAIAGLVALGVFIALVAASALRPQFAPDALPEPATWSTATLTVGAHSPVIDNHTRPIAKGGATGAMSRSFPPANKTNPKPFHSTWMTKERPPTWNRLSAHAALMAIPPSLPRIRVGPGRARPRAPSAAYAERNILTELCIARR